MLPSELISLHPHFITELGQSFIGNEIDRILHYAEQIKALQNRIGQLIIFCKGTRAIVSSSNGIGGREYRASRLQRSDDPSLGHRNRLLFHRFVYRRPILFVHLIELVDETDPPIGEYQRPSLVTGSLCTLAVSPTALAPFPVLYTARGAVCSAYFNI